MVENATGRYSGSSVAEADFRAFFKFESQHMESRTRGAKYLYESYGIKLNSF